MKKKILVLRNAEGAAFAGFVLDEIQGWSVDKVTGGLRTEVLLKGPRSFVIRGDIGGLLQGAFEE